MGEVATAVVEQRRVTSGRAALVASLVLEDFPQPAVAAVLSPNGRAHWAVRKDAKNLVYSYVVTCALRDSLPRMRGFVVIQPVWTFPTRQRHDPDNLGTGVFKACLDALVRGRWLEDDSTNHVRLLPAEVHVVKGVRRLELRFEVSE